MTDSSNYKINGNTTRVLKHFLKNRYKGFEFAIWKTRGNKLSIYLNSKQPQKRVDIDIGSLEDDGIDTTILKAEAVRAIESKYPELLI